MENNAANIIEEIRQIKVQYKAEVSGRGRAWPKAIKVRAMRLSDLGMRAPDIAEKTGISFHTVTAWKTAHLKKSFHQLPVVYEAAVKLNRKPAVAVTATKPKKSIERINRVVTVTVTTPDGFAIQVESPEAAAAIISQLRKG